MQYQIPESITTAIKLSENSPDAATHSELSHIIAQAIEWHRSDTKESTALGSKLSSNERRRLQMEEQRIVNLSDIFSYEINTVQPNDIS